MPVFTNAEAQHDRHSRRKCLTALLAEVMRQSMPGSVDLGLQSGQSSAMTEIHPIAPACLSAVLALNTRHEDALSPLDAPRLTQLVETAYFAGVVGEADAFMIAFDETSDYDSPNFLWFRVRYPRFTYVDRIAVAESARGRGLARRLYEALFEKAAADGHSMIACEVNLDPPNPASDAFHAALGFREVGTAGYGKKTVRYFVKEL